MSQAWCPTVPMKDAPSATSEVKTMIGPAAQKEVEEENGGGLSSSNLTQSCLGLCIDDRKSTKCGPPSEQHRPSVFVPTQEEDQKEAAMHDEQAAADAVVSSSAGPPTSPRTRHRRSFEGDQHLNEQKMEDSLLDDELLDSLPLRRLLATCGQILGNRRHPHLNLVDPNRLNIAISPYKQAKVPHFIDLGDIDIIDLQLRQLHARGTAVSHLIKLLRFHKKIGEPWQVFVKQIGLNFIRTLSDKEVATRNKKSPNLENNLADKEARIAARTISHPERYHTDALSDEWKTLLDAVSKHLKGKKGDDTAVDVSPAVLETIIANSALDDDATNVCLLLVSEKMSGTQMFDANMAVQAGGDTDLKFVDLAVTEASGAQWKLKLNCLSWDGFGRAKADPAGKPFEWTTAPDVKQAIISNSGSQAAALSSTSQNHDALSPPPSPALSVLSRSSSVAAFALSAVDVHANPIFPTPTAEVVAAAFVHSNINANQQQMTGKRKEPETSAQVPSATAAIAPLLSSDSCAHAGKRARTSDVASSSGAASSFSSLLPYDQSPVNVFEDSQPLGGLGLYHQRENENEQQQLRHAQAMEQMWTRFRQFRSSFSYTMLTEQQQLEQDKHDLSGWSQLLQQQELERKVLHWELQAAQLNGIAQANAY